MSFEEIVLNIFNLNKDYFSNIILVLGIGFVVVYLMIILWVVFDINKRTENPFAKIISIIFVSIFSVPGLIIYLLFRPHLTLSEKEENKLYSRKDILITEEGLRYRKECFTLNKAEFKFCITCGSNLHFECPSCLATADPTWRHCPYCKYKFGVVKAEVKKTVPNRNISKVLFAPFKLLGNGFKAIAKSFKSKPKSKSEINLIKKEDKPAVVSVESNGEQKAPEQSIQTSNNSHNNQNFLFKKKKKKKKKHRR